ncbi:hypothetical protein [Umezakia ovalisporum]|nr:hypothetical protein [Umezakia ovalisporum]MDH6086726.1 hypothetical protein [Umezakia ovalisporum TAC611]
MLKLSSIDAIVSHLYIEVYNAIVQQPRVQWKKGVSTLQDGVIVKVFK